METAIAGGGLLAILIFFVAFVLFWVALPGMITGWLLKRSGRSYGWGFVLGLFFGPLGILIGLIFALIGAPQNGNSHAALPAHASNSQADVSDYYVETSRPGGEAVQALAVGAGVVAFCVICGVAFMMYQKLPGSPAPLLVASNSHVAPVPTRPPATPAATAEIIIDRLNTDPELSPATTAEPEDDRIDAAPVEEATTESQSLEALDPVAESQGAQQKLPLNFEFKRETGQETGVPLFILLPREEAMIYDAARGSSFEALGMATQPERDKYGIIFYNAKDQFQLHQQKEKGVLLRIDGEEIKIPAYEVVDKKEPGKLKLETAVITVSSTIFQKLVKAEDVFIRVGIVMYSLDEDNINALHYYGAEIAKDIARRNKRK